MLAVLGSCVFLVLNQLIYTYPRDIRSAPPILLLNSQMYLGLHIDGYLTALPAGAVVRVSVLALLPFGPRPATSTP